MAYMPYRRRTVDKIDTQLYYKSVYIFLWRLVANSGSFNGAVPGRLSIVEADSNGEDKEEQGVKGPKEISGVAVFANTEVE